MFALFKWLPSVKAGVNFVFVLRVDFSHDCCLFCGLQSVNADVYFVPKIAFSLGSCLLCSTDCSQSRLVFTLFHRLLPVNAGVNFVPRIALSQRWCLLCSTDCFQSTLVFTLFNGLLSVKAGVYTGWIALSQGWCLHWMDCSQSKLWFKSSQLFILLILFILRNVLSKPR